MRKTKLRSAAACVFAALSALALSGCTVHPPGEKEERASALRVGKPFEPPIESRQLPPLSDNPSVDELVAYGLTANADVEQKYWAWRAALEQIPQDGTQSTTLTVSAGSTITRGRTSLANSSAGLSNDSMSDIKIPGKLDAAARQALENARAAGRRFFKARYELRAKLLNAYYDYALGAELLRIEQDNRLLLQTMLSASEARNRAGAAGQQDIFKTQTDLDLSANDFASMQSQLPAQRAAINAILSRDPQAQLQLPQDLPAAGPLELTDAQVLALAAKQNPELRAQEDEIAARQAAIRLAKLQYVPDFNLSASTDLMGNAQSLLGQVTLPVFRHEALDAAIAQAQDNLRAAEAMRRQSANDLTTQLVMDIATLRDADRQLDLFEHAILPRSQRGVELARTAYESGRATLLELIDTQRSLVSTKRLVANLRIVHARRVADLEALTAASVAGSASTAPSVSRANFPGQ